MSFNDANEISILSDSSGKFNPGIACQWNLGRILEYSQQIYYAPNEWGITEQDIIDALHHSWPIISNMIDQRLIFDQRPPSTTGLGYISCSLDGVTLPAYTVYDYFGWLLTVSARPRPDATSENYYVPLLSCFANWCLKIAAHTTHQSHAPAMVSIAVYEKHTIPPVVQTHPWREVIRERRAFLGATIPDARAFQNDANRATVINHGRQLWMEECGLIPQDENQRRGTDPINHFQEPEKGFGRCAETFFWVFARVLSRDERWLHDVKGVALVVRSQGEPTIPLNDYDEQAAFDALANPCNASCKFLAEQINEGVEWAKDAWWVSFDKANVKIRGW